MGEGQSAWEGKGHEGLTIPGSIAMLAQRQPLCWADIGLTMLGQRGFVNWPNGGVPTLVQGCANIGPTLAH